MLFVVRFCIIFLLYGFFWFKNKLNIKEIEKDMPTNDVIPQNREAFAVWFANFILQLPSVAAKYGIDAAKVTALEADNGWVQYWVPARDTARQQDRQVSDFMQGIIKGELGAPPINNPKWELPADPPLKVLPGIEKRIREVINEIKSQKSLYAEADGELLGILSPEELEKSENDWTAELINPRSLANYGVKTDFRKYGMDAVRVEVRHKGDDWMAIAFLTKSPGVFNVNPQTVGNAEQIELRAVYIKDNQPYGNYSPIYAITVAP